MAAILPIGNDMDMQSFVTKVLTNLNDEALSKVLNGLAETGATCLDELSMLPIEIMMQHNINYVCAKKLFDACSQKSPSAPLQPINNIPDTTVQIVNLSDFVLDLDKFGNAAQLNSHNPITEDVTFDLVHETVRHMQTLTGKQKPGRQAIKRAASQIAQKWPQHFTDKISGKMIGCGHATLIKKIEHRIDNTTRKPAAPKRQRVGPVTDDVIETREKHKSDKYGYIILNVGLSAGDTEVRQEDLRVELASYHKEEPTKDYDIHYIGQMMEQLFPTLYHDLQSKFKIEKLLELWPFIFYPPCLFHFFFKITGKNAEEKMTDFVTKGHCRNLLTYLSTCRKPDQNLKALKVQRAVDNALEGITLESPRQNATLIASIQATTQHLYENADQNFNVSIMRLIVPDTQDITDEEKSKEDPVLAKIKALGLTASPILIAEGDNLYVASKYHLVIENQLIFKFGCVAEAIAALFASFFVFRMYYPKEIQETYDFIQRFIMDINPTTGTRKEDGGRYAVKSKVMNLITNFNKFEEELEQ